MISGEVKLKSFIPTEITIDHKLANISKPGVFIKTINVEDNNISRNCVVSSEIVDDKFTLLSSYNCNIKWEIFETYHTHDMMSIMDWHPLF